VDKLLRASEILSGRRLYVEMTFAIVTASGREALCAVAMARDVTESVLSESALQAARPEHLGSPGRVVSDGIKTKHASPQVFPSPVGWRQRPYGRWLDNGSIRRGSLRLPLRDHRGMEGTRGAAAAVDQKEQVFWHVIARPHGWRSCKRPALGFELQWNDDAA
jgi:hypothetical protein